MYHTIFVSKKGIKLCTKCVILITFFNYTISFAICGLDIVWDCIDFMHLVLHSRRNLYSTHEIAEIKRLSNVMGRFHIIQYHLICKRYYYAIHKIREKPEYTNCKYHSNNIDYIITRKKYLFSCNSNSDAITY